MTCHAIGRTIVGPDFRDVATKYASNSNAAALGARNIRNGGSGKWVPIRMSTFGQLSDAEADLLAFTFYLNKPLQSVIRANASIRADG